MPTTTRRLSPALMALVSNSTTDTGEADLRASRFDGELASINHTRARYNRENGLLEGDRGFLDPLTPAELAAEKRESRIRRASFDLRKPPTSK